MKLMRITASGVVVAALLAGSAFLFFMPRNIVVVPQADAPAAGVTAQATGGGASAVLPGVPEAAEPAPASTIAVPSGPKHYGDIGPQQPLANPPSIVKGIYLTGWSAGSAVKMRSVINLVKNTELNAVVIDIKDYSGYVSYAMDVPGVLAAGAENEIRIARPNALLKELHDNGVYAIGRITDFQDPILAKAHPEWALHDKTTGGVWKDKNGLAWMDPAAAPVRDYLASIVRDAFDRGFDEVQFDYVRFASDGAIGNISYPYWNGKTPMAAVIADYFKFLRDRFPDKKISADLFGLATINNDDLGIGQVIQSAYRYFDYVSPMVYPSHYAPGFLGYAQPAKYPYEVIRYSMEHALAKLIAMGNSNSTASSSADATATAVSAATSAYSPFNLGYIPKAALRPWLQDFEINGVPYTAAMIRKEKQSVYDTLATTSASQYYGGWLMWDASNQYTVGALDPK